MNSEYLDHIEFNLCAAELTLCGETDSIFDAFNWTSTEEGYGFWEVAYREGLSFEHRSRMKEMVSAYESAQDTDPRSIVGRLNGKVAAYTKAISRH